MSGRRRTGFAAASAVDMASRLIFANMEDERERRRKAEELYQKFQLDMVVEQQKQETQFKREAITEGIKNRSLIYNPSLGTISAAPPREAPAGLVPKKYTDEASGIEYGWPEYALDQGFAGTEENAPNTETSLLGGLLSNPSTLSSLLPAILRRAQLNPPTRSCALAPMRKPASASASPEAGRLFRSGSHGHCMGRRSAPSR